MKKFIPSLFAVCTIVLSSCTPSVDDVAAKLEKGEKLDDREYAVLLEYTEKSYVAINDSILKYEGDNMAVLKSLQAFSIDNPNSNAIGKEFLSLDPATLNDDNKALYDRAKRACEVAFENLNKISNVNVVPGEARGSAPAESPAPASLADTATNSTTPRKLAAPAK